MGTHISRVKSVDLDAWTDEQTQSMVSWGNKKANSYWEAKLDQGHVPAESKIDNFVKTKYVSKRWVDQDERPDPDSLSDDEAVPVKPAQTATKQAIGSQTGGQRSTQPSRPIASVSAQSSSAPPPAQQPIDSLLGMDFSLQAPIREIVPESKSPVAQTQQAQSNLALLSSSAVPASTQQQSAPPRNDLKMSIMSLYASAPKPQQYVPQMQHVQHQSTPVYNNVSAPSQSKSGNAFDDLNGLFGGMNVQAASPAQRVSSAGPVPSSVGQSRQTQAHSTPVSTLSAPHGATNLANSANNDPWGAEDDAWGGFQSETKTTTQSTKQASAFDDLYSTSVSAEHRYGMGTSVDQD